MKTALIVFTACGLVAAGAWLVVHLRRVARRLEEGATAALDARLTAADMDRRGEAFRRHVDQALAAACDPDSPYYDAVIEADQNRARCRRPDELALLEACWRLPARRPATHGKADS